MKNGKLNKFAKGEVSNQPVSKLTQSVKSLRTVTVLIRLCICAGRSEFFKLTLRKFCHHQ